MQVNLRNGYMNVIFNLSPLFLSLVTEGSSLDIVRELSFIATDREGSQWRAEVRK